VWTVRYVVGPCLLAAACAVGAQTAKPDGAEAAAAMERAKRLADNPMKVILQAGKIRRKPVEADPAADTADVSRRAAARSVAEAAPAVPAAGRVEPAAQAQAAPRPAEPTVALVVLEAAQLSQASAAEVAPIEVATATPAVATPMPKMVAPQALASPPPEVPKLVSMVGPEVPTRLLAESPLVGEIYADLSLRPDGTVASVALLAPFPRSWQRYLMAALEQWRFEPLSSARVHRVQLVFNER